MACGAAGINRQIGGFAEWIAYDQLSCLLETSKLAAVPTRLLKAPVASLTDHQSTIASALDFLFQGYRCDPRLKAPCAAVPGLVGDWTESPCRKQSRGE